MSRRSLALLCVGMLSLAFTVPTRAGQFRQNAVGGVSINAEGVIRDLDTKGRAELLKRLREELAAVPGELDSPTKLRKISLRKLQEAIAEHLSGSGGVLPDEIKYLAGLQRIQYVFVYPDKSDIVIAGPGEGWKVDDTGAVVGKTTGKPVLRLDDLLVALRTVHNARTEGITCSIDPTDEGYRRLQTLLDSQSKVRGPRNIPALERAMKEAFGPQQVKITGVPGSSHFARVLLAADYRMKRYGMRLEPAPVAGLPSYVDLLKKSSVTSPNPRWWLACNYDSIAKTEDGLAWEIRNPGVKAMTEDEFVDADGNVSGTGRTSPIAKQWADMFTEKYVELSQKDPIFAELQNLMDLCVVAALIEHNDLFGLAGMKMGLMADAQSPLAIESLYAPRVLAPQCSFLRTRKGWVVTASGGVEVRSWEVASNTVTDQAIGMKREASGVGPNGRWWWN